VLNYLGALCLLLFILLVLVRVWTLKTRGVTAMKFGSTDKSDFLILPFALFYLYIVFAAGFGLPGVEHHVLFHSAWLRRLGALLCLGGLFLMAWSLRSFGTSFRVGIDTEQPDKLVTSGVFAFTRNPIYVAFGFMLAGEFLIQPTVIPALYLALGAAIIHRQVLREEAYLRPHYGAEYEAYAKRVRRYL
jgi:protein-S-isoprenylcysteine O-methyltransferase Ste14